MKMATSYNYNIVCVVVTLLMYGSAAAEELAYTITVDPNGVENFTTVQSAIDSIPILNQKWIRIFIQNGVYRYYYIVFFITNIVNFLLYINIR